jgi:hypothetical protein
MERTFTHNPIALTAGQIRALLADLPDDTAVVVSTLRAPSSDPSGRGRDEQDRFVVVYGALEPDWIPPRRGEREGHFEEPGTTFVLGTDFEASEYYESPTPGE